MPQCQQLEAQIHWSRRPVTPSFLDASNQHPIHAFRAPPPVTNGIHYSLPSWPVKLVLPAPPARLPPGAWNDSIKCWLRFNDRPVER